LISAKSKGLQEYVSGTHKDDPYNFSPRILAGLYAVASICYHGNGYSPITDQTFDNLCYWLRNNFQRCKVEGADMLDMGLLECNAGYDVNIFVKPYHDIVAILLGRPCGCINYN